MFEEHDGGWGHVKDAIRINKHRAPVYSQKTSGRSLWLSRFMILFERVSMAPLGLMDLWGRRYNRQGIPIIAGDFVSMTQIKDLEAPLTNTGQAPREHWRTLRVLLRRFLWNATRKTATADFAEVAKQSYDLLTGVHALEDKSKSLFSMTRHLVESIGFAALHAIHHERASRGRTRHLSRAFILTQVLGLLTATTFDRMAQRCHALGAGIVENDVPFIPFEPEWEAYASTTQAP